MIPLNQLEQILQRALDVWHSARAEGPAAARSQGGGRVAVEDRAKAVPSARRSK
jgi:hypothetical protein